MALNPADSNLGFGRTNWQAFVALHDADPERAHDALNALCRVYWPPLYAYARRKGIPPHDAEDLVQGLLERLCERDAFRSYAPTPGIRFRTWLIACFNRFEVDEWRKGSALRRGGKVSLVSLDWEDEHGRAAYEVEDSASPEAAYDASVARVVCREAFRRLEAEQTASGSGALYRELAPTLLEPRSVGLMEKYRGLAGQFGMTPDAMAQRRKRLKTRFGEMLREEIGRLVASAEEIEDELRHLLRALA